MIALLTAGILWMIAIVSINLYQNSDHDVTKVLAAAAAMVCTVWGFAIAHWGVLLICLFLLIRNRFLLTLKPIIIDKY